MSPQITFATCAQWLDVVCRQWITRLCRILHVQRSNYPIPPGLGGPTVKLLLNAALPWMLR